MTWQVRGADLAGPGGTEGTDLAGFSTPPARFRGSGSTDLAGFSTTPARSRGVQRGVVPLSPGWLLGTYPMVLALVLV